MKIYIETVHEGQVLKSFAEPFSITVARVVYKGSTPDSVKVLFKSGRIPNQRYLCPNTYQAKTGDVVSITNFMQWGSRPVITVTYTVGVDS